HFGDRTALIFGETRISHRDCLTRAERLAAGLAAAGIGPGDRIGVLARNAPEFVDIYGAAAFLGAIVLPVNWRLNPEEMPYVLNDGAPKILVVDAEDQPRIAPMTGSLGSITGYYGIGTSAPPFRPFAELAQSSAPLPAIDVDADEGYVIIPTA